MTRYSAQTWADGSGGGTPLSAARLGVMETGIVDAYGATYVVAASDSPDRWKSHAMYTCDGTADDVQINAAIDAVGVTTGTTTDNSRGSMGHDCLVLLAPGTYYCTSPIDVHSRVTLRGASRGGVVIQAASGHSAIGSATSGIITISDPAGDPYDHNEVSSLSIHGRSYDLNGIYSSYAQSDASKDDGNLGGTPDHHNILRDLVIVSCGRSGVYLSFTQASTAWQMSHVKVFGCGDTLNTSAGIYFNGLDAFIDSCDVGSHGATGSTTNYGFQIAGSDTAVSNCIAWLTKGTGFLVTGANLKFTGCESHHSDLDGWEITGNRNDFAACQSYNNNGYGWKLSANSVSIVGCRSYYYTDSYGHTQTHGIYLTQTNPAGHHVDMTSYGSSLTPIAGASTDAALKVRKPNTYIVRHTGANQDGSSGTLSYTEWRFGCYYGYGTATPEGAVSAPIGSVYTDYTNGNVYKKASGTGNTGWTSM